MALVRAYYAGTLERVRGDTPDERQAQRHGPTIQEGEVAVRDVGRTEPRDASAVPADDVQDMRQVRDRGDVIEVPIVEEELVKRPVVKEILRIRKDTVTDRQQVNEELRKEDVEIERDGDVDVRVEQPRSP